MDPSQFIAPEDQIAAEIQKAHFAPPATFQGKELWPYTAGTKFYLNQAFEPEDLLSFRDLAFCFVHLKRGGKTVQADVLAIMPVMMTGALLRITIGEWLDELSGGDHAKADAIYAEAKAVREAAYRLVAQTAIITTDPESQKKMMAPAPTTTASSLNSSLLSTVSVPMIPAGKFPSGKGTFFTAPSRSAKGASASGGKRRKQPSKKT